MLSQKAFFIINNMKMVSFQKFRLYHSFSTFFPPFFQYSRNFSFQNAFSPFPVEDLTPKYLKSLDFFTIYRLPSNVLSILLHLFNMLLSFQYFRANFVNSINVTTRFEKKNIVHKNHFYFFNRM